MARDLTKGSILGTLLAQSVPTILGMVGQTLYDVIDLMWIGRISEKAVAGVALFTSIFWLMEVLNEIIGMSSVALITQAWGAKDTVRASRVIEQTIAFKIVMAALASVILYVSLGPLVRFFTADPEVIAAAVAYGRTRTWFIPVMFATFSCFTALRCTGDAQSQMWIMLGSSVLNAVLAPVFMFREIPFVGGAGLGMGVQGAALATALSISAAFIVGFGLLASGRTNIRLSPRGLFRLDPAIDRKLLTIGLPSGGEMLARQASGIVATRFVAVYGTGAIAALGIGNRLWGLLFMPIFGLATGGAAIAGQSLGSGNTERAEKTARTASLAGGFLMIACVAALAAFPRPVLRLFIDAPDAIDIGVTMIRATAPFLIVPGFLVTLGCVFTASGYNVPFLVGSLAGRWGAQVPFLLVTVLVLPLAGVNLGIVPVWISFILAEAVEGAIVFRYYRKGAWRTRRV